MRIVNLAEPAQLVALAEAIAGRSSFTSSIQCQYSCLAKGRCMKGASGVRGMVLYEMPAIWAICARTLKSSLQMMWRSTREMARRIDDGCKETRIPGGFPLSRGRMSAWFQRQCDPRIVAGVAQYQVSVGRW